MMELETELRSSINDSPDPLERALIYSRIGNYIDFAALSHVKKEELLALIEAGKDETLDQKEYIRFCRELSKARSLIENADVIISKGQGNFETLHGYSLNIYYLFLCKCQWFMRMFQAEKFQGMFVNENRISSEL